MIEVLLGYKSVWRVLLLFSFSPGKGMFRGEIKRHTGLRNVPLDGALRKLSLFGVLQQEGRIYRLDMTNDYATKVLEILAAMKRDLRGLPYELLLILDEFVRNAIKSASLRRIVLFGSHAKFTARKDSDIDICIITSRKDKKLEFSLQEACERILEEFGRAIQLHYFTESDFEEGRRKKDPLVMDTITDGISLLPMGQSKLMV